ncbi:hypothetical protein L8N14_023565, partial [Serratia marcescens]|nr:hypothetical protein [Serratia marcescens]
TLLVKIHSYVGIPFPNWEHLSWLKSIPPLGISWEQTLKTSPLLGILSESIPLLEILWLKSIPLLGTSWLKFVPLLGTPLKSFPTMTILWSGIIERPEVPPDKRETFSGSKENVSLSSLWKRGAP